MNSLDKSPEKIKEAELWDKLDNVKERVTQTIGLNSEEYTALSAWQSQKFEVPRRLQIMQESENIIEETNNVDTLITRKKVLDEHLNWFRDLEKHNSPFHLTGGVDSKQKELDFRFNEIVFRI